MRTLFIAHGEPSKELIVELGSGSTCGCPESTEGQIVSCLSYRSQGKGTDRDARSPIGTQRMFSHEGEFACILSKEEDCILWCGYFRPNHVRSMKPTDYQGPNWANR